jgi:hypothetical protein
MTYPGDVPGAANMKVIGAYCAQRISELRMSLAETPLSLGCDVEPL